MDLNKELEMRITVANQKGQTPLILAHPGSGTRHVREFLKSRPNIGKIAHEGAEVGTGYSAIISYRFGPDSPHWDAGPRWHLVRDPLLTVYSAAAVWRQTNARISFMRYFYGDDVGPYRVTDNPLLDCMRTVAILNERAADTEWRFRVEDVIFPRRPEWSHNSDQTDKWERIEPRWAQLFDISPICARQLRDQAKEYGYVTGW